ncbi:hypothetical protein MUK42_10681 [Musa troglodytarum]|uniref:Uncharacterized protein n=1 Tax=Musa troglodytarum TaxID=320322 RepID=A0A9E7GI09_9LILI|nr:hypothetical protein MUK42_10681 [Musa troglodytarum]
MSLCLRQQGHGSTVWREDGSNGVNLQRSALRTTRKRTRSEHSGCRSTSVDTDTAALGARCSDAVKEKAFLLPAQSRGCRCDGATQVLAWRPPLPPCFWVWHLHPSFGKRRPVAAEMVKLHLVLITGSNKGIFGLDQRRERNSQCGLTSNRQPEVEQGQYVLDRPIGLLLAVVVGGRGGGNSGPTKTLSPGCKMTDPKYAYPYPAQGTILCSAVL